MKSSDGSPIETQFEFLTLASLNVEGYIVLGFDFSPQESGRDNKSNIYKESERCYNNVFIVWPIIPKTKMRFILTKKEADKLVGYLGKKHPLVHYQTYQIKRV